jgi:hypothetical protein
MRLASRLLTSFLNFMNIFLWIIQVILAIKLLTVTLNHGFGHGKPEMSAAILKLGQPARLFLVLAALGTLLGALGLILPGLFKLDTHLTSIVAGAVALMLLVSIFFHLRSRETPKIFVSLVLAAFAIIIATGRW